jgi:hypothetical protein
VPRDQLVERNLFVIGLVFDSLICLVIVGAPADALSGAAVQGSAVKSDVIRQSDVIRGEAFGFVKPSGDPLVIQVGRSRLLRFPGGVQRVALSDSTSSDIVQVSSKEILVLAKKQGVANLTVWPLKSESAPLVLVVRVEQRVGRDR